MMELVEHIPGWEDNESEQERPPLFTQRSNVFTGTGTEVTGTEVTELLIFHEDTPVFLSNPSDISRP